jgi:hypothetical protein
MTLRLRHDRNGYDHGAPKARKYLLTGLAYCGRCGWPLFSSRMYDTKDKTPRRVYFCFKRKTCQARLGVPQNNARRHSFREPGQV